MAYSKTSGFMDFFSGFKEAGDTYDKENFAIRAEDLKAKRDAIIEMKKVKYSDEISQYKKDKEKIDSLNSLKAQFGSGEIDAKDYGLRYTMATKGSAEIANIRKVFERDRKGFDNYFANIGKSDPLKNDTVFKNFKERSVIDSNYLDSINAINSKYSNMLKTAKNDSVLVNAILGKRDAEIAELSLNEGTTKNNIEVADKVNEIQTTTKSEEETDSSKEVESLSSYTITDKDRVYGVPQWWKEESKIADVKKDVKKDVDTSSKQLINTSYESLRDVNLGKNIKQYILTEQGRADGAVTGYKSGGTTFNKQVGLITNQALNFQTDIYLYNKTGEDANKLTSFLSFTDTKNITQDRIKSYSGVNTVLNTKKGLFKKDNFLGIVPFSIVGLEDVYIPTKGDALKFTGDTKTVGAAYFNALKTITEKNDPEFKKSSQGEAMNALQEKLLNLRPDQQSNLLNEVKAEMEKTLKINEQKEVPTDSKGEIPEGVYYEVNGEAFEINDNNTKLIIERGGNPDDFKKIGKLKEEGGDGSVAESVVGVNQNVFKDEKIKPDGELGDTKFSTLESVLKILPEAMSGADIKEKYAIDFPINEKTMFRPLK